MNNRKLVEDAVKTVQPDGSLYVCENLSGDHESYAIESIDPDGPNGYVGLDPADNRWHVGVWAHDDISFGTVLEAVRWMCENGTDELGDARYEEQNRNMGL